MLFIMFISVYIVYTVCTFPRTCFLMGKRLDVTYREFGPERPKKHNDDILFVPSVVIINVERLY